MKTAIIQIGNSDDKLTQKQWSQYVDEVNLFVRVNCQETHFSGGSPTNMLWQNYCWVVVINDEDVESLMASLNLIRKSYNQDSIALTIGETIFV